ncbi:MAG: Inosine-5'-monophosphate dehydrogenase [Candidatus Roizmanbacteria bacterium GW2011_GWC2_37_13]|uniref:Inosine-5'-monophosphate dehydrogenase n=1 Tax=Candidatus Roizmanbacteria bacterium GW2011_GWC2_37_13 TaxID=1618486 RepID=A0A0G0J933_9BACT|nr:MAG: inosine-5'-monophosphate dehydrogenase, IMP dehydrogenase [Candidatus Roizmanbacteria bacterium GW2011_GWC1_37_12]KKQ24571.1 MAG: Inosine-5'-monophosphate dehydrogenase [Candidatus Roizmanbacteria bacterium GW2011_GWC2_37_13]
MLNIRKDTGLTFDDVLLVPKLTAVESRSHVDLATRLTKKITLKTPIVSANMDTVTEAGMAIAVAQMGGIGIIHRFLTIDAEVEEVKKVKKERLLVGAAIGIKSDYLERCKALIKAGADTIVIDIAHSHSSFFIKVLKELTKKFPKTEFIAGNVASADATEIMIKNGAAAVKVGIGPGALCTTRIVTGAGVPQLTAIADSVEVANKYRVPIIADGGIKQSGDIVKALAAGASTVMIGTLFAGCEESPALTFFRNNKKYKMTRGMASLMANADRQRKDESVKKDLKIYAAEGVEAVVPYRGHIADFIYLLLGGVKSGFSYCGAHTIKELWKKAEFIQITQSSLIESAPHDVEVM